MASLPTRLARRLPAPLFRALRGLWWRLRRLALRVGWRLGVGRGAPPDATPVLPMRALPMPALPGPLLTELAPRLAPIPGWFNLDDLAHFTLVLGTQRAGGITGDLLEIGCFHGRAAAVLALALRPGERLLLIDAFDLPVGEPYGDTPTPAGVRANLHRAVPDLDDAAVEIVRADSRDLAEAGAGAAHPISPKPRFRLAHVDGGHAHRTVLADLGWCAARMLPGGVIVVDDYAHPDHPGVTTGTDAFLAAHPDWLVFADLNRAGARGRKRYLHRRVATAG